MKRCNKCGVVKPISEFHHDRRAKDGHVGCCRQCNINRVRQWEMANRERKNARARKWCSANPLKVSAKHRRWHAVAANRERKAARMSRWRSINRESINARRRAWHKAHPEKPRAHLALRRAIRAGTIVRPNACQMCGSTSSRLQGHHDNYTERLKVDWLCSRCHAALHWFTKVAA
jgi:hypothetical protein